MKPLTVHDLKLYGFKNLGRVNDFRVYRKNGLYVTVKKGKFKAFSYGSILDCNPAFQSLEYDAWFNFGQISIITPVKYFSELEDVNQFEIGEKLTKHKKVLEKEENKTLYRPIYILRRFTHNDGIITITGSYFEKQTI